MAKRKTGSRLFPSLCLLPRTYLGFTPVLCRPITRTSDRLILFVGCLSFFLFVFLRAVEFDLIGGSQETFYPSFLVVCTLPHLLYLQDRERIPFLILTAYSAAYAVLRGRWRWCEARSKPNQSTLSHRAVGRISLPTLRFRCTCFNCTLYFVRLQASLRPCWKSTHPPLWLSAPNSRSLWSSSYRVPSA